jgi:two-component system, sensor histidine kinase and response regulator
MKNRDTKISPFKIMIVDDDPLVVKALERILFRQNYLFFSVGSGEEALIAINEIEPDIVLLDVFMKELSGFDVCRQFKKMGITQRIPVIFLTSNNQPAEIITGFQAGAVDYITKPFNSEELLARLHTHLELKKAREEIRIINMQRTRFFSIMTHDINDALTGVRGVAGFLHQELSQEQIDMEEVKKLAGFIHDDSNNLYQFVNKLVKWNRLQTGAEPVHKSPFDLRKIIDVVVDKNTVRYSDKQITVNISGEKNMTINSDSVKIADIMDEILTNALKYSHKGGIVNIELSRTDRATIIKVIDQGVGMEKDVIENIFRLDTPHPKTIGTDNEKGIGLGLIICNALLSMVGGIMCIDSDNGVTVTVELPDVE